MSSTMSTTSTSSDHNEIKSIELRIAALVAKHNIPFKVVDHLEGLIKEIAKYPDAAKNISIKRSKCTAIIKNVLGNYAQSILIKQLQSRHFSLLIDESTDITGTKHLAIVCRFVESGIVHDKFLELLPIPDATALKIYEVIVKFFTTHSIDYKKNLIGFGADGANTMMGERNSVQTLLKGDVPHLVVVRCVCHSLALCANHACSKLPSVIEELVRDIHTYFQHSFKRQHHFKNFQNFVGAKPHRILQNSQTRWLSLLSVVRRVIEQYDALKYYFTSENLDEHVASSKLICDRLYDKINLCYLQFLEFVLPYIVELNIEFQSESPKLFSLYHRMSALIKIILECYIKPEFLKNVDLATVQYQNPRLYKILEDLDLGPKIAESFSTNYFSESEKRDFRITCLNFYIDLVSQIFKRFPFHSDFVNAVKLMNFLHPPNIRKINSLGHLLNSNMFRFVISNINDLEKEWRFLRNDDSIAQLFELGTMEFWKEIGKIKKGDDSLAFPNVIKLISFVSTLPHSNACVERIFSKINVNKTKLRNRLSTETLSSILHAKNLISSQNESCCFNFNINSDLIDRHNNSMYKV